MAKAKRETNSNHGSAPGRSAPQQSPLISNSSSPQLPRTLTKGHASKVHPDVFDDEYIPDDMKTTPNQEEQEDEEVIPTPITFTDDSSGAKLQLFNCAIPGLENLFLKNLETVDIISRAMAQYQPARTVSRTKAAGAIASRKSASKKAARKASLAVHEDGDPIAPSPTEPNFLYINDIKALRNFYGVRLKELTMKPLRQIVTSWVKELSPKRTTTCGAYHNLTPGSEGARGKRSAPWWPLDIPYKEPSHLEMAALIPLAIDIMLIHRTKDLVAGKCKNDSEELWISKLRKHAVHQIEVTTADNISSSSSPLFGHCMKERALRYILPSLFDIAEKHEMYVRQWGLFEGSGNKDPGFGLTEQWETVSRPQRESRKTRRAGRQKRIILLDDDEDDVSGRETSPLRSPSAGSDHTKCAPEPSRRHSPAAQCPVTTIQPAQLHRSTGQLHMDEAQAVSASFKTPDMRIPAYDPQVFPNMQGNYPYSMQPNNFYGCQMSQAMATPFSYPDQSGGRMICGSGAGMPSPCTSDMNSPCMSSFGSQSQLPLNPAHDFTGFPDSPISIAADQYVSFPGATASAMAYAWR